jgi:hypothetical protein
MIDYSNRKNLLTRTKAIKSKCLECCCGRRPEVKRCTIYTCSLWPYRLGTIDKSLREKKKEKENVIESKKEDLGVSIK